MFSVTDSRTSFSRRGIIIDTWEGWFLWSFSRGKDIRTVEDWWQRRGYADMRKSKYMTKIFRVVPSKLKFCCPVLSKPLPRSQIHFSRFPRLPYTKYMYISPHLSSSLPPLGPKKSLSANTFIQRDANACHPEISSRKYISTSSFHNIKWLPCLFHEYRIECNEFLFVIWNLRHLSYLFSFCRDWNEFEYFLFFIIHLKIESW